MAGANSPKRHSLRTALVGAFLALLVTGCLEPQSSPISTVPDNLAGSTTNSDTTSTIRPSTSAPTTAAPGLETTTSRGLTASSSTTTTATTTTTTTTTTVATTAPAPTVSITIGDNFFDPADLGLDTGTRLVWTHDGNNPHTVTTTSSPGKSFASGVMTTGQQFVMDLDEPGTYEFFCEIHPNQMTATITITDR